MAYYQVIRELREEVEKLRQLLKDQGGPSGTASDPAGSQDIAMLREKLSISENLMQEMSKTWEQKLAESEKLHQVSNERLSSFELTLLLVIGAPKGTGRYGNFCEISWYWCTARQVLFC